MASEIIRYILFLILISGFMFCSTTREERSKKDEQQKVSFPLPAENLAPGSVRISASLINKEQAESGYLCKLKVLQVLGYGMGASPLSKGTEIDVEISNEKIASDELLAKKMAEEGERFIIILKAANQKYGATRATRAWKVMRIK